MTNAIKISIVLLNYNGLKYLRSTLPPLLKLRDSNYEIIVVDNGSMDGSLEYLNNQSRVKVIVNKENLGYSKGKNQGVREAKGEYVLLLDNDIQINNTDLLDRLNSCARPDTVFTFVMINKNENKTKYYGGYFNFYGINENSFHALKNILAYQNKIECAYPHGGCLFFPKKFWTKIFGGYDERQPYMLDDNDLGMRAWISDYKCIVYNEIFFTHLGIENQTNDNQFYWKYRYYFSGLSISLLKNCTWYNYCYMQLFFWIFCLLKTIKQSLQRKSLRSFVSFFSSIILFFRLLPETLKIRKIIQKNRIKNTDIFLSIKPPMIK